MSHVFRANGTFRPNFLESEVGLVLKTYQFPAAGDEVYTSTESDVTSGSSNKMFLDTDDFGNKIVPSGSPFYNGTTFIGIVYNDVDVTHGAHEGSVLVAGRVLKERLPLVGSSLTSHPVIVVVDAPETSRGYTVTYTKGSDSDGVSGDENLPVDLTEYQAGSYATVSAEHPLKKADAVQLGWGLENADTVAVTAVKMDGNKTLVPVWLSTAQTQES